LKVLLKLHHYI